VAGKRGIERVREELEWKVSGMKLMAGPRNVISKSPWDLIGTKSRVAGYFDCFRCGIGRKLKRRK
jgi:hypothetical protein